MSASEGKLTKKFLMSLPAGHYLISNTTDNNGNPIFAEYVVPMKQREEQWQRIKEAGANNRLGILFKNQKQANDWLSKAKKDLVGGSI